MNYAGNKIVKWEPLHKSLHFFWFCTFYFKMRTRTRHHLTHSAVQIAKWNKRLCEWKKVSSSQQQLWPSEITETSWKCQNHTEWQRLKWIPTETAARRTKKKNIVNVQIMYVYANNMIVANTVRVQLHTLFEFGVLCIIRLDVHFVV